MLAKRLHPWFSANNCSCDTEIHQNAVCIFCFEIRSSLTITGDFKSTIASFACSKCDSTANRLLGASAAAATWATDMKMRKRICWNSRMKCESRCFVPGYGSSWTEKYTNPTQTKKQTNKYRSIHGESITLAAALLLNTILRIVFWFSMNSIFLFNLLASVISSSSHRVTHAACISFHYMEHQRCPNSISLVIAIRGRL